jgi:predicted RND superfamily exporter protein
VLACGFAVTIAAGTKSISYFGLVATLAIAGAALADLLLLPVLLSFGRAGNEQATMPPTPETADAA